MAKLLLQILGHNVSSNNELSIKFLHMLLLNIDSLKL